MAETLVKDTPLTPEEAAQKGYAKLQVGLGDPMLNFSTYALKNSLILRRHALEAVVPSGFLTLASIYVPEHRNALSVDIDAFVFDGPVEAQPCADEALLWRDYSLKPASGQHGLFVGGGSGMKHDGTGRTIGVARTYAVVRGRIVVVLIMQFSKEGVRDLEEEADVFISNLRFDNDAAPGFLKADIVRTTVLILDRPLELAYPRNWRVSGKNFPTGQQSGTIVFSNGDPAKPSSVMTFGFRHGSEALDEASLYAWGSRIADEYRKQNPQSFSEPRLERKGQFAILKGADIANAFYIFSAELSPYHEIYQIRTAVIGKGDRRFAFSLLTDGTNTAAVDHFLNYAYGVTAFEIAVDSFMHWLIDKGFE